MAACILVSCPLSWLQLVLFLISPCERVLSYHVILFLHSQALKEKSERAAERIAAGEEYDEEEEEVRESSGGAGKLRGGGLGRWGGWAGGGLGEQR